MAGALVGRECKTYYNSASYASPTWVEITRAIDVSYSIDPEYGDVSSRASIWKMSAKAMNALSMTFNYRYRQGATDTVYDALRAAAYSNTKTEFAFCDGAIATTGNEYLRATFQLGMGMEQPLGDGVSCEFPGELCSEEDSGTLREPACTTVS